MIRRRNDYRAATEEREKRVELWGDKTIRIFFREFIRWVMSDNPDNLFFRTYCLKHEVFSQDIERWRGTDKQWDAWYKKCMEAEQAKVALFGSRGRIQPIPAIFYLKAQHGWQEVKKVEHSGAVVIQTDIKDLTA